MEYLNSVGTFIISFGGFIIFWYVIISIVGKVSGWGAIANRFPDTGSTQTPLAVKRFQNLKIGLSNYSGIVTMSAFPQGLRLSLLLPFKPGHEDLLIPWQELAVEHNKGVTQNMYKFSFQSLPDKSFLTGRSLGEWIVEQRRQYVV